MASVPNGRSRSSSAASTAPCTPPGRSSSTSWTEGTTPPRSGADWLASGLDQNLGAWVASPLGGELERISISWLLELFGLPEDWGGVLTTGATMANFVALACARRWCGLQRGVDVDDVGLAGLPPIEVFGSGYVHPSDTKALGMLGIGRSHVHKLARDGVGRLDVDALRTALAGLGGAPAIVIGSAGEVNAGDFDPIGDMADVAHEHGAWFHVDGAFGLFAALSNGPAPGRGIERADSVIADGHKWLNVPYDCGFAFVRDRSLQRASSARARRTCPRSTIRNRTGATSARDVPALPRVRRVGDAPRLRAERLSGDRRNGASTSRNASRRDGRWGRRPRATRRGSAQHRVLPRPSRRWSPRIASTSSTAGSRSRDRGRPRVLRAHHLRRESSLPAGARELPQPPGGHRSIARVVQELATSS
jgi:hypothetical protein